MKKLFIWPAMKNMLFSLLKNIKNMIYGLVKKVTDALIYLLDSIYIRFCSKLYRQNVGIPIGTNCAPLVADLFLFCSERDFMKSLTKEKRYFFFFFFGFSLMSLSRLFHS